MNIQKIKDWIIKKAGGVTWAEHCYRNINEERFRLTESQRNIKRLRSYVKISMPQAQACEKVKDDYIKTILISKIEEELLKCTDIKSHITDLGEEIYTLEIDVVEKSI